MGDQVLSFRDFSRRLFLGGGRDTIPRNALRRCVGCAPEPEPSLRSRWGSTLRFNVPNVISMGCFSDSHYLYDGASLWRAHLNDTNAVVIDSGYNGDRMTMIKAPPAIGLPDYLFVIGGGKLRKIAQDDTITNWGIAPPSNKMTASLNARNQITIDDFNNSASSWNAFNCSISNETTYDQLIYSGVGSLRIAPNDGPWRITRGFTGFTPTGLNLALYANDEISLPTDYISFRVYMRKPTEVVWLWLEFDVDPVHSNFKTNYYRAVIQVVPTTGNFHAADAAVVVSLDADRWVEIAIAKSQFQRIGSNLNLDWSNVQKVRISGGDILGTMSKPLFLDFLQQYGGVGIGTGPAALTGGSTLKYLVTFGNSITGNDSNPCDQPTIVTGIIEQAIILDQVSTSDDPQVDNRKIWRTSEDGDTYSYLDTIPDNVTTRYMDVTSSLPGQPLITTPWTPNVAVIVDYYVDGGNGYAFRCLIAGTTGATVPFWSVPGSAWARLSAFDSVGDTILPRTSIGMTGFELVTPGISGPIEPLWGSAPNIGDTITDGTCVWRNRSTFSTVDNTVTWVCQVINALPSLGVDQIRYDNSLFPSTCGDAAYFGGSMLVGRDTAPGNQSYVYVSSPGRNEGYANILRVGSEDDPIQKIVIWDERAWVFTSRYVYPLGGDPPDLAVGEKIIGAEGTSWPYTVVPTPSGIVYRAVSGVRVFNNATNELIGFEALGASERGQAIENVNPFLPIIAADAREEVFFSDGLQSFAFSVPAGTWRMLGVGFGAVMYHDEIQVVHAATSAAVLDWEVPGALNDSGQAIPIEWQTPSELLDATQLTLSKRIWIDIDLANQTLTPTLLVDDIDYPLPEITGSGRKRIPIPFQKVGGVIGIRFTGNVLARVILYGVWGDMRIGADSAATQLGSRLAALAQGVTGG